jgi:hypothetical protein
MLLSSNKVITLKMCSDEFFDLRGLNLVISNCIFFVQKLWRFNKKKKIKSNSNLFKPGLT